MKRKQLSGLPSGTPACVSAVLGHCDSALYCDDVTLVAAIGDESATSIQQDLERVDQWAKQWRTVCLMRER